MTAIHSHMLEEAQSLFFMHFWANDDAKKLATAHEPFVGSMTPNGFTTKAVTVAESTSFNSLRRKP